MKLFSGSYVKLSDEELMELVVQNDSLAFETLYFRYKDRVYSYYYFKLGSAKAEEELQETFLKLYKFKDSFKNKSKFKTWLWAIVKNQVIDTYRTQEFQALKNSTEFLDDLADEDILIDEELIKKSNRDELQRAINELNPATKEVFYLHIFSELTFIEIAETLNTNQSSIKTLYFRGLKDLRKKLKE